MPRIHRLPRVGFMAVLSVLATAVRLRCPPHCVSVCAFFSPFNLAAGKYRGMYKQVFALQPKKKTGNIKPGCSEHKHVNRPSPWRMPGNHDRSPQSEPSVAPLRLVFGRCTQDRTSGNAEIQLTSASSTIHTSCLVSASS